MRILRPLRDKPVAVLWSGLALAAIGDQLYIVALSWLAVRLIGPGAGYVSAMPAGATLAAALKGTPERLGTHGRLRDRFGLIEWAKRVPLVHFESLV